MFPLVYVNDMIVTESDSLMIDDFVQRLNDVFSTRDISGLHYFIEIKVHMVSGCMHLSKSKYVKGRLEKSDLLDTKVVSTPMILRGVLLSLMVMS